MKLTSEERIEKLNELTRIAQQINQYERAFEILNKEYGKQEDNGSCLIEYDQESTEYRTSNNKHFNVKISKERMKKIMKEEYDELKEKLDKVYNTIFGE